QRSSPARLLTLHVLSTADRQPLVLHRPGSGRDRILGLVRVDVRRDAGLEAGKPGPPRSARDVRHGGQRGHVAMDHGRRGGGALVLFSEVLRGALGCTQAVDVGLARTLFSWPLPAIVFFGLIPAYIAFYTMVPRAAGGRLYSDTMGRLTFILFLLYSLPVG